MPVTPRKKKRKRIQGPVRTPKRVVYPGKLPAATDVVAIECPICADIVWSRHVHDYRSCFCEYCFIDGGRDYTRAGWGNEKVQRPWPALRYLTLRIASEVGSGT